MKKIIHSIDLFIEINDEILKYINENKLTNKNDIWNTYRYTILDAPSQLWDYIMITIRLYF